MKEAPNMNLKEYFTKKKEFSVLSTAEDKRVVNSAGGRQYIKILKKGD